MSDERHYSALAKRPAPGTVYDFMLAGQKILDAELTFGATSDSLPLFPARPFGRLWLDPMWRAGQSYYHNRAWEKALDITLNAIAAPFGTVPAFLPRYADVVCRLADQFLAEAQEAAMLVRYSLNLIPSRVRVIAAAKAVAPNQSSTKAADYLNLGRRCGDLTRDHVNRAWHRLLRDTSAQPQPGPAVVLSAAVVEFEGLQFILAEAQQRADLRMGRLQGAPLAESLNSVRRLATFLDRAPSSLRDFRELFRTAA